MCYCLSLSFMSSVLTHCIMFMVTCRPLQVGRKHGFADKVQFRWTSQRAASLLDLTLKSNSGASGATPFSCVCLLILELKLLPNVALRGDPNARKLAVPCRESSCARSFSFRSELSIVDFEFSVSNNIRGKQRKMISLSEVTIHSMDY